MTHVTCGSKLRSVVRSSMHPWPGNWVVISHAVVYYARLPTHLVQEARHCRYVMTFLLLTSLNFFSGNLNLMISLIVFVETVFGQKPYCYYVYVRSTGGRIKCMYCMKRYHMLISYLYVPYVSIRREDLLLYIHITIMSGSCRGATSTCKTHLVYI